jgi:lysophospholipase L1-like esterase
MWKNIKNDLAPLNIIHRGFGGSTMKDILIWKNIFLRYKANTVVIYEGDNDLSTPKSSAKRFLQECKLFCQDILRQNPKVKIYFISIKPSVSSIESWPRMNKANELLKIYASENPQISFIEASAPMFDKDDKPRMDILLKDKLHMNKKGYAIWTKHVRKALQI